MSEVQSAVPKVVKTMTIGEFACWLIINQETWSNQQILDAVLEVFKDAKTSMASIAWYKTSLRKKGLIGARSGSTKVINQDALAKYMKMAGGDDAAGETETEGDEQSTEGDEH